MVCHGDKGDGRGQDALNLDPPPTNFLDTGLMRKSSPFQAFNTINWACREQHASISQLSEKEVGILLFILNHFPIKKRFRIRIR